MCRINIIKIIRKCIIIIRSFKIILIGSIKLNIIK